MNAAEQDQIAELREAMREGREDRTRQIAELKAVLLDRMIISNERISALEGQMLALEGDITRMIERAIEQVLAINRDAHDAAQFRALQRWVKTALGTVVVVAISAIVKLVLR